MRETIRHADTAGYAVRNTFGPGLGEIGTGHDVHAEAILDWIQPSEEPGSYYHQVDRGEIRIERLPEGLLVEFPYLPGPICAETFWSSMGWQCGVEVVLQGRHYTEMPSKEAQAICADPSITRAAFLIRPDG